jgi:hypothetical protein
LDWFTKPEIVRLPLSGGQFIDVKKRLNHGEREGLFARWSPLVTPGEPMRMDRREVRTAKVLAYLVGWSATLDGQPIPYGLEMPDAVRLDTLNSLDADAFSAIHDAIEGHEEAQARERAAQKKIPSGSPPAASTSPSPPAAAGTSNGSAPSTPTITPPSSTS